MRILQKYNIRADFFEINPMTETVPEFVDIRDGLLKLKTKVKLQSDIMWAIALVYDYDSLYFNLEIEERRALIAKEFLKEPTFFRANEKVLAKVIDKYMYLQRDSEKRYLEEWNDKMDKISKAIKGWKVTEANLDEQTDIMKKQKILLEQKDEVMDRMMRGPVGDEIRGGGELSLLESGKI